MSKRPIDRFREAGGGFKIESEDDNTPIVAMCNLNDGLALITEKGVYEVVLADQIDPKRENAALPHNVQKRILNIGSESILLAKTLLTANALFKANYLPPSIDVKKAMSLTFEALVDLVDMKNTFDNLKAEEDRQIEVANNRKMTRGSLALPSISDIKPRTKSFVQKADHISQAIIDMIITFYPKKHAGHFETEVKRLRSIYNPDDGFVKFLDSILPFMKMLRNLRDSLDHRNAKGVSVESFTLAADSTITVPTIAMKFRGVTLETTSLSLFMSEVIENLLAIIENLIAALCDKQAVPFGGAAIRVAFIPDERRQHKNVQFGYCINFTGQWTPIG